MAENQRSQTELHRHLAPRYELRYADAAARAFHAAWHRDLVRELEPSARVLEIGCGTGRLLADLLQQKAGSGDVVGLDLSGDMLHRARTHAPAARCVLGDGERLPFASASFDALILKGCLHHLRDHRGFFIEAQRVLRRGGRVVLSEPTEDAPWIRMARAMLHRWRAQAFDREDRAFRTRELEQLITSSGFELEASRPFGWLAYLCAGFPDHLPILRWMPGGGVISRALIALDAAVLAVPLLHLLAFQRVIVARAD